MKSLQEIINNLREQDLKVSFPNERLLEIAIQIQRNEILEEAFSNGNLNDLVSSIDSLQKEVWELNQHVKKLGENLKD